MSEPLLKNKDPAVIECECFQKLLNVLIEMGYQVVGPTIGEGAIVYDRMNSVANLPIGWTNEKDGGSYRLKKRDDQALFGYVVGPHSWKKFLLPSVLRLWQARRVGTGFQIATENDEVP